jgi:hypothetical protein
MPLIDRLGGGLPRGPVMVELDDVQATVLRYRPEPYYGTHACSTWRMRRPVENSCGS